MAGHLPPPIFSRIAPEMNASQNKIIFPNGRFTALKLFVFLASTYLLFMNPSFMGYDIEAYLAAQNIVSNGSIALSEEPLLGTKYDGGVPGLSGKRYSRSGVLDAIVVLPFYILGTLADRIAGFEIPTARLFFVLAIGPIIAALCGVLFYAIAAKFYDLRTTLFLTITYCFGTPAFPYLNLRIETLMTMNLALMLFGLLKYAAISENGDSDDEKKWMRWALIAGIGAGAAIATKSYALILTIPGCLWFFYIARKNYRHAVIFFIPIIFFISIGLEYNNLRFGGVFNSGYPAAFGFDLNNLAGCVYVLFFSPAKSNFLFSPILIIGILALRNFYKSVKSMTIYIAVFAAILILFISTFREPLLFADEIWGSRYFFPAIFLLTIPVGAWIEKGGRRFVVACSLAIAGFVVSLPGILIRPDALYVYTNRACLFPTICRLLDPSMNAIVLNAKLLLGIGPADMTDLSRVWLWWIRVFNPGVIDAARIEEAAHYNTGSTVFVVIAVVVILVLSAVASLVSLARNTSSKSNLEIDKL